MSMIAAALLSLAAGQAPATNNTATNVQTNDPMVCERQEEIGSRLKAKRICMRKSEWAAQRELSRQQVERTQIQRGVEGGG